MESHHFIAMANVKAPMFEPKLRAPINLCAVIDRSGSMDGAKLILVKKTLEFIVSQLKPGDSFGMVTFESEVETNLKLTKMDEEGKDLARQRIKKIVSAGSTNLSGGMIAGLELIQQCPQTEVTSVLLMTDGLANVGVIASTAIVTLVKSQLEKLASACTIFTFGFGSDHDDKMLKGVSEAGKGLYYFLENEDGIPQAFGNCLGGLISVVAQNIKLHLEPLSGTKIKKILSKKFKTTEIVEDGQTIYELNIGDLYSEEERNILCELEVAALSSPMNDCNLVKFVLTYFNVVSSTSNKTETILMLDRPEDILPAQRASDICLDKQRNRILAADALEEANQLGNSDKLEEARNILEKAIEKIKSSPTVNDPICTELVKDLKEALDGLQDRSSYTSKGSKYMSSKSMSHHYQRGTHTSPTYTTSTKSSMTLASKDYADE